MKHDDRGAIQDDYDTPEKRVAAWNAYREENPDFIPDVRNASLKGVSLSRIQFDRANLFGAKFHDVNLSGASFSKAILENANLHNANLTNVNLRAANLLGANLSGTDLSEAMLARANLHKADLSNANLSAADLTNAELYSANLSGADLSKAKLVAADLTGANLTGTNFSHATLRGANFSSATLCDANVFNAFCARTVLSDIDLTQLRNLATVRHHGPSPVSTSTFALSNGRIPEVFLRGCGLSPWQVLSVRLYDPILSPVDVADIWQKIFDERTKGYFLNGVFISYSHADEAFVEGLYARLQAEGANVWLDNRHAVAGPLEKQVERAIRLNDIVLLVLSESSIESDWVEAELEWARNKEKATGHDILCPVALDDSWKGKVEGSVLWRKLKDKNILDFSQWETDPAAFDVQFRKLLDGMKVWYGPQAQG